MDSSILEIEKRINAIEDSAYIIRTADTGSLQSQIYICRKDVRDMILLLTGKSTLLRSFFRHCCTRSSVDWRSEASLLHASTEEHVHKKISSLEYAEQMLSRSHSSYLSQLSVERIRRANRIIQVLTKITMLSVVILSLNLIVGLFGMNVPVPGGDMTGLGWWFGILGAIVAILLCSLLVARWKKLV